MVMTATQATHRRLILIEFYHTTSHNQVPLSSAYVQICTLYIGRVWKRQKVDFSQNKLQKAELLWKHSFLQKLLWKESFLWSRENCKKHFRFNPTCSCAVFLALYFPVVFCNGRDYHTQWGNRCSFVIHIHMHLCMHMWREGGWDRCRCSKSNAIMDLQLIFIFVHLIYYCTS